MLPNDVTKLAISTFYHLYTLTPKMEPRKLGKNMLPGVFSHNFELLPLVFRGFLCLSTVEMVPFSLPGMLQESQVHSRTISKILPTCARGHAEEVDMNCYIQRCR